MLIIRCIVSTFADPSFCSGRRRERGAGGDRRPGGVPAAAGRMRVVPVLADYHDHGHQEAPAGEDSRAYPACSSACAASSSLLSLLSLTCQDAFDLANMSHQDCLACWQEILEIEQIMEDNMGMELTEDNIEKVLDEIRPYLVGESLVYVTAPAAFLAS